jgi:hypothetical protein
MNKLIIILFISILFTSCGTVRDNFDIGRSIKYKIKIHGTPTEIYNHYEPIALRNENPRHAVKTLYFKSVSGSYYYYFDSNDIVVESLYFDNDVQF